MKKVLLGILAVVVGLGVGMAVNMGLINLNMKLHPPPAGFGWDKPDMVKDFMATMPLLGFVIVLLAHSGQALVGSVIGTLISGRRSVVVGLIIGAVTLLGCVMGMFMIPAPLWFSVVDLLLPVPVAYLAARLLLKKDE